MEKVFVAKTVASKLYATEAAVDAALTEAAQLLTGFTQARTDLKIAATFGNEANVKLMAAMQALTEARTAMVGVHEVLGQAQLRLGIRTKADWSLPASKSIAGPEVTQVTMREVG